MLSSSLWIYVYLLNISIDKISNLKCILVSIDKCKLNERFTINLIGDVTMNKELRIMHLENRIAKLNTNPVENVNLIRKAKRQLRKLQG